MNKEIKAQLEKILGHNPLGTPDLHIIKELVDIINNQAKSTHKRYNECKVCGAKNGKCGKLNYIFGNSVGMCDTCFDKAKEDLK